MDDFDEYAAARWPTLVRTGVLLGCSLSDAEDLAQEVLLRCYLKWARVQSASNRDAYVARILVNMLKQSRRRRWWGEKPTDELPDVALPDSIAEVDEIETVRQALAGLSRDQRQVVALRFVMDLSALIHRR